MSRPLETVDVKTGETSTSAPPPAGLGFLFCMCQRDIEADLAACAPTDLEEGGGDVEPAPAAFTPPPALRTPKMFGVVHEEILFACVVASRMAYADRHVADALAEEPDYAEGLDFIDKVLPQSSAIDRETVASGASVGGVFFSSPLPHWTSGHLSNRYCVFELARPRYPEVHAPKSTAVVAFRGTMDTEDTYTNLDFAQCDFEPIYAQGRVHAGFYGRARDVNYDPIANLFKRYDRVVFTGHSLGGAVAKVALLRCLVSAIPRLDASVVAEKALCVTFGPPQPGNGPQVPARRPSSGGMQKQTRRNLRTGRSSRSSRSRSPGATSS